MNITETMRLSALDEENAALKAANNEYILWFKQIKADYDAALEVIETLMKAREYSDGVCKTAISLKDKK
jgi:hypothetical protein